MDHAQDRRDAERAAKRERDLGTDVAEEEDPLGTNAVDRLRELGVEMLGTPPRNQVSRAAGEPIFEPKREIVTRNAVNPISGYFRVVPAPK